MRSSSPGSGLVPVPDAVRAMLVFGLLCWLLVGCGGGGSQSKGKQILLDTDFADAKVGKEAAEGMAAQMGIVDDPELTEYVAAIGRRMVPFAPQRPFEYSFHIVDQAEPNAFALPGGYIYVSRGLLALSNSEDELAGVIGHEITHAAERHTAGRQEFGRRLSPLSMGYMRAGQLAAYSRDQERDADRGGQIIAARAGWDPGGIAQFLQDLSAMERKHDGDVAAARILRQPSTDTGARGHRRQPRGDPPMAAARGDRADPRGHTCARWKAS